MKLQFLDMGTVTSPRGFLAGAVIREGLGLGILFSEAACRAAGLFTRNQIKAASVKLSQRRLEEGRARAVVVNRGCANAGTGEKGMADAEEMAHLAATKLNLPPEEVLVASTGVIGTYLPLPQIRQAVEEVELSSEGGHEFARAILTTDRVPKEAGMTLELGGKRVVIGGVAKGAGMIHPDLATMLCFLTTDAMVEPAFLRQALKEAVDNSFNLITVDGDTSPNDTVVILANGLAGNPVLTADSSDGARFREALKEACLQLAQLIAQDGEGATRLIEVQVEGALSLEDARLAARTIASSPLVKAAVYGSDPNWGRIIAALGRSGARVEESKVELYLGQLCLFRGQPLPFDREEASRLLSRERVKFRLCLNLGEGKATSWGCDLSPEYVTINSAYTT